MSSLPMSDSERLLYASMEHSPIGMALTRMDGSWIDVNPALCDILGYSKAELMVAGFKHVTLPKDREATVLTARKLVATGQKSVRLEKRYIHSSGRIIEALLHLTVARDAAQVPIMFISQIIDVTAARQLEHLKGEFITTVNHELRTPLTSIMGALQLLEVTVRQTLPAQAQDLLSIASKNTKRLKSLLDDILEMELVISDQGFVEPQEVDLTAAVDDAVAAVAPKSLAAAIPVRVETSEPLPLCQTYPDRLQRVLRILFSNAIKYSDAGGEVVVTLDADGGLARISVSNSGLPIPDALRSYIFQPFVQGEATDTRRKQGSGLGLAIAQKLTASMGGRIDFVSNESATTFWLELPFRADMF